jgi:acyl-CoA synthetase (AMP-forming)/AMP-acid ligase II
MSSIQFLLDRFSAGGESKAITVADTTITYNQLLEHIATTRKLIIQAGVCQGDVVVLKGDYSLSAICAFLTLAELGCVTVPLTPSAYKLLQPTLHIVFPRVLINCTKEGELKLNFFDPIPGDPPKLLNQLVDKKSPGLVLFTSGSSGTPKAVVHDFSKLLQKFHIQRPAYRTINFLLFDHWGGLNTLLHSLSNLSHTIVPENRTPDHICGLIEKHKIELLPATPGFLNMFLLSRPYLRYSLESLKVISYGAEPMPEKILKRLSQALPKIDFRQTYGMIELGVLRAKSETSNSLWVKLGGEGYQIRIVDNKLQIKADSAMLGYLNAPSPFTDDGYLMTGDLVEQKGDWIKILGRDSDLINVGGQKVYPSEVEAAILNCEGVQDVMVRGEANPILGMIVTAVVVPQEGQDENLLRRNIKHACQSTLQAYMVPVKIAFINEIPVSSRLKRVRN